MGNEKLKHRCMSLLAWVVLVVTLIACNNVSEPTQESEMGDSPPFPIQTSEENLAPVLPLTSETSRPTDSSPQPIEIGNETTASETPPLPADSPGVAAIPVSQPTSLPIYSSSPEDPRWYLLNRPGAALSDVDWQPIPFSISPTNNQYQYVSLEPNHGVLRSEDYGETWTNVFTAPFDGSNLFNDPVAYYYLKAIADPLEESRVYLSYLGTLLTSPDAGLNWYSALQTSYIGDFTIANDGKTIYVLTTSGVLVSHDGGISWENTFALDHDYSTIWGQVTVDAKSPSKAYVLIENALHVTNSAGQLWTIPSFLSSIDVKQVIADRSIPDYAFAITEEGSLYRTSDGGNAWGLIAELALDGPILDAVDGILMIPKYEGEAPTLLISYDGGVSWKESNPLPIADDVGGRVYVRANVINDGILKVLINNDGILAFVQSADNGETWEVLGPLHRQNDLALSQDAKIIYTSGYKSFRSSDGGGTWQENAVIDGYGVTNLAIAVSPHDPDNLFIIDSDNRYNSRLLRSNNGGQSWSIVLDYNDSSLRLDCNYLKGPIWFDPSDANVIYIASPPGISRDGGESWTLSFGDDENVCVRENVLNLAFHPDEPNQMILSLGHGLRWTPDGGATTQLRGLGSDFYIYALAYDPNDAQVVFVVADTDVGLHLYRSTDGGITWELWSEIGEYGSRGDAYQLKDLIVDPRDSMALYLLLNGEVFHSTDGGVTWEELMLGVTPTERFTELNIVSSTLFAVGAGGVWRFELPQ